MQNVAQLGGAANTNIAHASSPTLGRREDTPLYYSPRPRRHLQPCNHLLPLSRSHPRLRAASAQFPRPQAGRAAALQRDRLPKVSSTARHARAPVSTRQPVVAIRRVGWAQPLSLHAFSSFPPNSRTVSCFACSPFATLTFESTSP